MLVPIVTPAYTMLLRISWLVVILGLCLHTSYSIKRRCLQPLEVGSGKAYLRNWFYNSTSESCQRFIFYGGAGNGNNFNTKARCRRVCLTN